MDEELILIKRLDLLRNRHDELDKKINAMDRSINDNQFLVMRMKKEKLALRDKIVEIERIVYPDIIA